MWRPPMSGPNSAGGGRTILARARDLVRNNPWIGAAIDKSTIGAIGSGIQAKAVNGSTEWKAADKRLWKRFCREIDAGGVLEFDAMTALVWREWREAGEVFARIRARRASDGLAVPVQIQLIESEQCPRDYNSTASNGNVIRSGIELSKIGRPVAYWMCREHPGDRHPNAINGSELVRVPADEVLHLFRPLRAGQLRGTPDMAAVIVRAFNLDRLDDAVLERQKVANLFTGWYTRGLKSGTDSVLDEATVGTDSDETPIAGMEPGTMQELPAGVEPKFSAPPGAGGDYAEFVRYHLMAIAAKAGVPVEMLTGDLRNVSDRALRLILAEFRRGIESDRWLYLLPKWCQAVRDAYMDAAVLSGALPAPNYAADRDLYTETLWVPDGWAYSHPVQDVDADIKAVRAGFTSRTDVILTNGDDPEDVDARQTEDNQRADSLGLKHDSDGRRPRNGATNAAAPQGDLLDES
ncbi:MAG: phage portal protein [Desulfurellales bacterium]|nr:MAG: phage portal protein [Desulfurellales bacterium]